MFRREQIGLGWLGPMYAGEDIQGRNFRMIPLRRMNATLRDEIQIRHRLLSGCSIPQAIPSMGIHIIHGTPYWLGAWKTGVQLSVVMQSPLDAHGTNKVPVAAILYSVIESLIGAAQKGVVHGDLQPSCVWLTTDGTVWLDGYGQKESAEIPHRFSNMLYVAPEGSASSSCDVYALGVILLELFLHRKPELYVEDAISHQKQVREYIQQCTESTSLLQIVARMLSYDANQRPSLLEIVKSLRVLHASKTIETWLRQQYPSLYKSNIPEKMIPQAQPMAESLPRPTQVPQQKATQEVTEKEESGDIDFSIDFSDLGMVDLLGEYKFSPILEKDVEVVSSQKTVSQVSANSPAKPTVKSKPSSTVAPMIDPIRHIFDEDAFLDQTQEIAPARVSMHHIVESTHDTEEINIEDDITLRIEDTVLDEKSGSIPPIEDSESTQALQMFHSIEEDFFTEDKTQQLFERSADASIATHTAQVQIDEPQNPWLIRAALICVGLFIMYTLYVLVFVQDVDFVKKDGVEVQPSTSVVPTPVVPTPLGKEPVVHPEPQVTDATAESSAANTITDTPTNTPQEPPTEETVTTEQPTAQTIAPKIEPPPPTIEKPKPIQSTPVQTTTKPTQSTVSSKPTEKKNTEPKPKTTTAQTTTAQSKANTTTENPWTANSRDNDRPSASVWDTTPPKNTTNEPKKSTSTQDAPVMEDIWGASAPVETKPPTPPVKQYGTVIAVGDASKIRLHKEGQNYSAGKLETGEYQVYATFAGFGETKVGQVTVVSQQKSTITCDSTFVNCKITP